MPVLAGAALRNKGIQPLLDAVCDYLPSPMEVPPVKGVIPGTEEEATRPPEDSAPFCALAFKVAMDEGRKNVYMRIYSGVLKAGDEVQNARTRRNEKLARLFSVHANRRERIERAATGNIVVAMGLKDVGTGDTLCTPKAPILLERIVAQEPVIARAIEPKTQADKEKLDLGLTKLADEDPTFRQGEDPRDRSDHHPGDGRAAPRHHGRPPPPRIRHRGKRGSSPGRLPRDAGQDRRG